MAKRGATTPSRGAAKTWTVRRLVATGLGIGYIPLAPGTLGSLLGAVLCYSLADLPWPVSLGATILLIAIATYTADRTAKELGGADPPEIVIDEIAGMFVAAVALPGTLYEFGAVFLLFRLMDIVKPSPISRLEGLPGGIGIVADDVAAALLARAMWWLLKANFDFF